MVATLLKSQTLRSKYLTISAFKKSIKCNRTAVVVGATSGIGEACAHRLAENGYTVIAVGRDRPGRAEALVQALKLKSENGLSTSTSSNDNDKEKVIPNHEFYPCDAFSLANVSETAKLILDKHDTIDALVLTQGMATTQGFTPTSEGNDEKLTLHYYSRVAMANALLPALRKSTTSTNGPTVLTVLSGGVHSPYKGYKNDPDLKKSYSVKNAADCAGFYTDLGFDNMALDDKNKSINFVHASPGFVNTNWGTEFNFILRSIVRCMQVMGKSGSDCAEYMVGNTILASDAGDPLPERLNGKASGLIVMGESGESKELTTLHTDEARDFVWQHTVRILEKAGLQMN
jgi:NAD(P)-dependent dehydrogenase (short-subunit alcohol dehydrogenase family)